MLFRARQFEFRFPRPALVMGIVNVTPDSFSDGGKFLNASAAVAHARKLVEQGAEILDIGGESTRPGAQPVSEAEELRRVIPVIEQLAAIRWGEPPREPRLGRSRPARGDTRLARRILISIDTMKPAVARAALEAGATMVNDVAANCGEKEMWQVVSGFHAGYICMHAPPALHRLQKQKDMVREARKFFRERLQQMKAAGISPEQIIFDPGIGFGKTLGQNLSLLANLRGFTKLRRPLLLGASRKSFIGNLLGAGVNERLPASLACATLAVAAGVQIIRTHDVAETVQAIRLAEAVLARNKN